MRGIFNFLLGILAIGWVASTWSNGHHGKAVLYAVLVTGCWAAFVLRDEYRRIRRAEAARRARVSEMVEAAEIVERRRRERAQRS